MNKENWHTKEFYKLIVSIVELKLFLLSFFQLYQLELIVSIVELKQAFGIQLPKTLGN